MSYPPPNQPMSPMYKAQLDRIDLTWKSFDTNGDGTISIDEFIQFMHNKNTRKQLGHYSLGAIKDIFSNLDLNQNGRIELTEFCKHLSVDALNKVYLDFLPGKKAGKRMVKNSAQNSEESVIQRDV